MPIFFKNSVLIENILKAQEVNIILGQGRSYSYCKFQTGTNRVILKFTPTQKFILQLLQVTQSVFVK